MGTKKVKVNGRTVEVPEKFTPEILLQEADIPKNRSLVALGPREGESRILPKGQVIEGEAVEFADIPVFRYGATRTGERDDRSPVPYRGE